MSECQQDKEISVQEFINKLNDYYRGTIKQEYVDLVIENIKQEEKQPFINKESFPPNIDWENIYGISIYFLWMTKFGHIEAHLNLIDRTTQQEIASPDPNHDFLPYIEDKMSKRIPPQ